MARDHEPRKLPQSAQGEGMLSGVGDAAVPVPPVVGACYYCSGMPAVVYCRADSAGLCLPCDRLVHGANPVSSRHVRAPLCTACRAAAAGVRRGAARFLCSNCAFEEEEHRRRSGDVELEPPLHDRGTVEGYTGCPSVGELAAILGTDCEKPAADEGWWSDWVEPQVLTMDDVIVPTTSCHGLLPLLPPSSPKNRSSSPCGELNDEVLRQLGELAKSEAAVAYVEAAPAGDQLPPWASSEYATGHDHLRALGTEASYDAAIMAVPSCQQEAWIAAGCTDARDADEQAPVGSSAEPSLSTFVEISDACLAMSRSIDVNGGHDDHPAQAAPPVKDGGYDIAYPDRRTVISRYKEKRKNRRFGKQIRYESRKARADGRLRIKGRFAKSS